MLAHQPLDLAKMPRAVLHLVRPELELDEGISAVFQMQDGVRLEAVAVAVVRDGPPSSVPSMP